MMAEANSKRVILSYHDSLITQEEVRILETNGWLNDILIGFVFEYMEHEEVAKDVLLVGPSVSQLIAIGQRMCAFIENTLLGYITKWETGNHF